MTEAVKALSAEEISELCLRHTLYDWSAQAGLKPMAVASAKGVYFTTVDGRRFIDFNSQLMCVNAGHGDRRIIDAIKRQAEQLAYISPFMAHEPRARLGRKLAELLPGDIDKVLFTLGGADANENAIKIARTVTGRPKILARYRSYHGSTGSAIQATGDPRRWANEFSTRRRPRARPVPRHPARHRTRRRLRSRSSRRRSSSRARRRSPLSSSSRSPAPTAS